MNRCDFLSSLPFVVVVSREEEDDDSNKATAASSSSLTLRNYSLSLEAYNHASRHRGAGDTMTTTGVAAFAAATPPRRRDNDNKDAPLSSMATMFFSTNAQQRFGDAAMTTVNVTLNDLRGLTMTLLPDMDDDMDDDKDDDKDDTSRRSNIDNNFCSDDNGSKKGEGPYYYYRIAQPPKYVEFTAAATEARPANLVLYYEECALRLFCLQDDKKDDDDTQATTTTANAKDASVLRKFHERVVQWQQRQGQDTSSLLLPGRRRNPPPRPRITTTTTTTGSGSSSTMSASPPAAAQQRTTSLLLASPTEQAGSATTMSPKLAKRARVLVAAQEQAAVHLRSLRALLLAKQHKDGTSPQADAALQCLQQFPSLERCYVELPSSSTHRRASLQQEMAQSATDALGLQHALRHALDAHFPVPSRRGKKRKHVTAAAAAAAATEEEDDNHDTTTTIIENTTATTMAHVQTLLHQHERIRREQQALALAACMVKRGGGESR